MFGYTMPLKPEMKIKDYTKFRAYYCGVCKAIGTEASQLCRMGLTYDATFLAILLSEVANIQEEITAQRCLIHPLKKQPMMHSNEVVSWAAAVNVLLAYEKLKDDWRDEHKVKAIPALGAMARGRYRVAKKYENLSKLAEEYTKKQLNCEALNSSRVDEVAEPTAWFVQQAVRLFCEEQSLNKNITEKATWIGYNVGKWIYLIDAFDDIDSDLKTKQYNVFIEKYKQREVNIKQAAKEEAGFLAKFCIAEAGETYNAIANKKNEAIMDNIIAFGMAHKTKQIIGVDV